MDMEVIHGLTSVRFTINHKPGAFFRAPLFNRQRLRFMEHPSNQEAVCWFQFHDSGDMLFRDYQEMNRPLGGHITESQDFIILIEFLSRYFP
jgi:hypothetical protein